MKNKTIIFLLSTMIGLFIAPTNTIYGVDYECLYAGATKEICELIKQDINNIEQNNQQNVYTTANVNVRKYPDINSEILNVIPFNNEITVFDYNDEWNAVYWDFYNEEHTICYKSFAYINKKYISTESCSYTDYALPENTGFKSFMPYSSITNVKSLQYDLQRNFAYTDECGIRRINGRCCVAIGTAFGVKIGTYFDLILENEAIIPCIVSDIKASKDTLADNITTTANGCVSEFVVDMNSLQRNAKQFGDISYCYQEWNSPIKILRIYNKNIYD